MFTLYVNPVIVLKEFSKGTQGIMWVLKWVKEQLVVNAMKVVETTPTGRLQLFLPEWQIITQDLWVLENVWGHKLEFTEVPSQREAPTEPRLASELATSMTEEMSKLLAKVAVTAVTPPPPPPPERVYFPHVSSSQEGWLLQTYHRSPTAKQVHQVGAFQDGRNPSSKGPATAGRLDGETGPEGCLLCSADSPGIPTVLVGNLERNSLPIQLPTVWPILGPKGVHEDHAPCYSMAETARMSNHYLHRRQPNHGLHKGGSQQFSRDSGNSVRIPGISGESHVPGVLHQFVRHDNSGATTETPENAIAGEEPARCHLNHRKRTGQVCGNSVLDGSGNSSCTSVLQSAAACEELCDQDT